MGLAAQSAGSSWAKGFQTLALFAGTTIVVLVALVWTALWCWRAHPQRRLFALMLVLLIHLWPATATVFLSYPADSWAFAEHWNRWGKALLWSLPAVLALLWALPWFTRTARWLWTARGLVVILYGALGLALAHAYRPLQLDEPLVEIVLRNNGRLACGRGSTGSVVCLGENLHGEFGNEPARTVVRPQRIDALRRAKKIYLGPQAICIQLADSQVRCLGQWQGARGRVWDATSSTRIADLAVTDDHLYFVSPAGAIESWSDSKVEPIAASSTERTLCGRKLLFLAADGHARVSDPDLSQPTDLGPASQIACYQDPGSTISNERTVTLDGTRLSVDATGDFMSTQVPPGAQLIPGTGAIWLRVESKFLECRSYPEVQCAWKDGPARVRAMRGDATAFAADDRSLAGKLAALSRSLAKTP